MYVLYLEIDRIVNEKTKTIIKEKINERKMKKATEVAYSMLPTPALTDINNVMMVPFSSMMKYLYILERNNKSMENYYSNSCLLIAIQKP